MKSIFCVSDMKRKKKKRYVAFFSYEWFRKKVNTLTKKNFELNFDGINTTLVCR